MLLSRSELARRESNLMESTDVGLQRLGLLAKTQLKNFGEGKTMFKYGLINKWKWRPMCYKNQNFRAYFTIQMYCVRADVMSKALAMAVRERMVEQNFFRGLETVVSFGCGPGAELHGFREYLLEAFPYSSRRWSDRTRFIGYDTELGWMHYIEAMGWQFFELRNAKLVRQILESMAPVDVILIPFSLKQTQELGDTQELNILGTVTSKARVVMVLDVDDCLPNKVLIAEGYRHFTVTDLLGTKVHVHCCAQSKLQTHPFVWHKIR